MDLDTLVTVGAAGLLLRAWWRTTRRTPAQMRVLDEFEGAPDPTVAVIPAAVEDIRSAARKLVADGTLPCFGICAARHGKLFLNYACGHADIDSKLVLNDRTILRFFSMTKPITSVAVMQLVEQGKIGLDDPV